MASNTNHVTLTGNIVRDPELRETGSGSSVVNFTIANNRYAGADRDDRVNFIDCVAFGKRAEAIAQYMSKGSPILIEGELNLNQWENDEGQKRSKLEVWVNSFEFIGGGKNDDDSSGNSGGGKKRSTKKSNPKPKNNDDDESGDDGDELF